MIGGLSITITSFVSSYLTNPYIFTVVYVLGFGFGKGFLFAAGLVSAWSHLPGRKGLASGVIISGFGFGGLIYGIAINRVVNPNNEVVHPVEVKPGFYEYYFEADVNSKVPMMFYTMGLLSVVFTIGSMILMSEYKPN